MRALPLALVVVLLALPGAYAQVPGLPTVCGPLSIPSEPVPPAQALAAGEQAEVTIEVALAGQAPARVTVAPPAASAGWVVVESAPETLIQPGSTASFRFVVSPGEAATGPGEFRFSASGFCEPPGGVPCPAGCDAGTANTQVSVPFRADDGFRLPGFGSGSFPLEYLIAAIVLVGLATAIPFAMRKRKTGLVASCPEPLKMVKPGRGTSFPIEIRNASRDAASATFEVGPVPEGWSAFMPVPDVQLAAREARSLWLMVRSPQDARNGEGVDVELRLRDAGGATSQVRVRAEVQGDGEA